MMQIPLFVSEFVDLDGHVDKRGIRYLGKAQWVKDNLYRVLANVGGILCVVEVKISDYKREA